MICRLGCVGMPLILAAINLKLPPSSDEIKIREKRVDSLSNIIRLGESLYDVMDFVAAGTKVYSSWHMSQYRTFFSPEGLHQE